MVRLQTLDLRIGVRVPASQPAAIVGHSVILRDCNRATIALSLYFFR